MQKYLLDTHIFIWLDQQSSKVSKTVRDIVIDDSNFVFISMASIWEMQIKVQLGKLNLAPMELILRRLHEQSRYELLPIKESHIINLAALPSIHKDPFDRLIISQAMVEGMILLSDDDDVKSYPLTVIS